MEPTAGRMDWRTVAAALRARGQRWTPQRRTLIEVLASANGHVTGSELVERCRAADPRTVPSTVYRTLDVLEDLGLVAHAHGADGREEFHVMPEAEHGHLHCATCGASWELGDAEAEPLARALARSRGFEVDLSHVTVVGQCSACAGAADAADAAGAADATGAAGAADATGAAAGPM
jgi:Fur family ferric uptake transcriptional regulator